MLAIIVASLITSVRGNIFKNILSERVHTYLRDQYKHSPSKCECMIEYFRLINIWEKFYSEDILGDERELVRDLRPYIEAADSRCSEVVFYQSPLGILVMVLAMIFAVVFPFYIYYPRAINTLRKSKKWGKYTQRPKFQKPKRPNPLLHY